MRPNQVSDVLPGHGIRHYISSSIHMPLSVSGVGIVLKAVGRSYQDAVQDGVYYPSIIHADIEKDQKQRRHIAEQVEL